MRTIYAVHILAGTLGLVAGYLALFVVKGARLHRKSGTVFVYAMLAVVVLGTVIAVGRGVEPALNVPAGLITGYLVISSFMTVRPPAQGARGISIAATLVALVTGLVALTFGFEAIAAGGTRNGMPAFPFFMFAAVGLLGSAGDLRVLRSAPLTGAPRLVRHLWRMCFALFIAALSFFIGQADVFPPPVRIRPLLALPVVAVLITMLYWLWRIRVRRSLRGLVGLAAVETARAR